MQIKLLTGPILQVVQNEAENTFELHIKYVDGRIDIIKMNPDEYKWFALDVSRMAERAV